MRTISTLTFLILSPFILNAQARIDYNPCDKITIFQDGKETNSLKYYSFGKQRHNNGVTFQINDFNVIKYDITVNNQFTNRFTEVPALFNNVIDLIGMGAVPVAGTNMPTELNKIIRLNTTLKTILNQNCAAFSSLQAVIRNYARDTFIYAGVFRGIDYPYNEMKKVIKRNDTSIHSVADYNRIVQENNNLPISPDSLVTETMNLYNLFISTDFTYQNNIIQLENADELEYTVNIKGKKDAKNPTLHVTDQPIKIPILGGFKIDFSTGFYYSNIKNEKYALRSRQVNDSTTKNEIVNDGNFNGGTLGIAALMHFYRRITPGFNPSVTFGLGKSLDLNYSILLGGSVLIGRQNRIAFSGGWNISNIKAISKSHLDDAGTKMLLPQSATDVSYYNKFKQGGFASFTYSFGLTQKKQAASADKEE